MQSQQAEFGTEVCIACLIITYTINTVIFFYLRSCFPWPVPYLGHYIVLCGYNSRKDKIIYRNPSYRERLCAVSLKSLDIARKSYGTDEDVVLIFDDRLNFKRKVITWQ